MLTFKKKFLDDIRNGKKTQTLRFWKHNRLRPGQKSFIPGVGAILIDRVDQVVFEELTNEDALLDGFSSLGALREELRQIYGENPVGNLYRIRFHLLDSAPNPVTNDSASAKVEKPTKAGEAERAGKIAEETSVSRPPLRMHTLASRTSVFEGALSIEETVEKLIARCKIYRSACDWNHEPGKSMDFFDLFRRSPRDERGVPTLDGMKLQSLMRAKVSREEWDEIGWLASDVCRAWTEWQYAIEKWQGGRPRS
ncbi:MAG: ASCH domain-containing protein [Planctomycetia bacterium]|nr:ASCH domain-containing protein [Planctomycetia bacterium]